MISNTVSLLKEAELFVEAFFAENVPAKFVFHDFEHTVQTVGAVKVIAEGCQLDAHTVELLQLATWFHDTGYAQGPEDHEERSCANAERFFRGRISDEDLDTVFRCIRATKVPQQPADLLEQIICDADLSHLGMEMYWSRNSKLRQEFVLTRDKVLSDEEWVDFELNFMLAHDYHTVVAREMLNKRKAKHIQQLLKQKRRLNPDKAPTVEELALMDDKEKSTDIKKVLLDSEQELKMGRFGRGVETMYRTTYRTHTNLSVMADSKANIMLTVNAMVITIMVSILVPQLLEAKSGVVNLRLGIPSGLLLATCLGSIIFATLSTRPKVTEGKVTREAIKQRKANLLFFGNFHNMPLEDFQWGINEMLRDPEFLYSTMSRDLYFLGIVLAKKYQYLSICYNIFMYGLIVSLLSFAVAFAI
ncbi:MAG: Pycsar system effector family protein [Saprospiraceae bacterium]